MDAIVERKYWVFCVSIHLFYQHMYTQGRQQYPGDGCWNDLNYHRGIIRLKWIGRIDFKVSSWGCVEVFITLKFEKYFAQFCFKSGLIFEFNIIYLYHNKKKKHSINIRWILMIMYIVVKVCKWIFWLFLGFA